MVETDFLPCVSLRRRKGRLNSFAILSRVLRADIVEHGVLLELCRGQFVWQVSVFDRRENCHRSLIILLCVCHRDEFLLLIAVARSDFIFTDIRIIFYVRLVIGNMLWVD